MNSAFYFVIDTNYPVNQTFFSYLTGKTNDLYASELFIKETNLDLNYFDFVSDYLLWETPGLFNDGLGNIYLDKTDQEIEAKKKFRFFCKKQIDKFELNFDIQERWRSKLDSFKKYPAFCSLAIQMNRLPTETEKNLLKKRANCFLSSDFQEKPSKILSFRIFHSTCVQIEECHDL